jgi:tRNA (guanine-N(7)-)-methyltransferase subunit TRM82
MEDTAVEEAEVTSAAEFAPALVAAHPQGHSVAVGPELRVFDLK